jgi:hypothetical protein
MTRLPGALHHRTLTLSACKELFSDAELFGSLSRVYGEDRAGTLWTLFKAAIDKAEGRG